LAVNFFGVPTTSERAGDFGELCTVGQGSSFDASGNCLNPSGQIYDPYTGSDPGGAGFVTTRNSIPFNNLATYASPGNPGGLGGTPFNVPQSWYAWQFDRPRCGQADPIFSEPNLPNGALIRNFFATGTNTDSNDAFDIKIDHQFSTAKLLSAKFSHFRDKSHGYNCFQSAATHARLAPKSAAPTCSPGTTRKLSPRLSS